MPGNRKRNAGELADPGNDSFLDVIANLVGILIILVVVVGASANQAWTSREQPVEEQEELANAKALLEMEARHKENLRRGQQQLLADVQREEQLALTQERVRKKMLLDLMQLNEAIERQKLELDEQARQQAEAEIQHDGLKSKLLDVQRKISLIQHEQEFKRQEIEHFPSPIAKTVFNQEYHFQLKHGRLAAVPIEDLIEKVKAEVRFKAEQLAQSGTSTVETVGPIAGFRMQYLLTAATASVAGPTGPVERRSVQFEQFIMIPAAENLGEPFDEALLPGSQFNLELESLDPNRSTISIWVYPENYGEFRKLKQWLAARGFKSAAWPMAEGAPITGGPGGLRSSSQ